MTTIGESASYEWTENGVFDPFYSFDSAVVQADLIKRAKVLLGRMLRVKAPRRRITAIDGSGVDHSAKSHLSRAPGFTRNILSIAMFREFALI